MNIFYEKKIKNGIFLTPKQTQNQPSITFDTNNKSLYTLIMHDPDAPVGNYLHWIVVNIPENKIEKGDILVQYKGPSPPEIPDIIHRYFFILLKQDNKIEIKEKIPSIMNLANLYSILNTKLKKVDIQYFTSKYQKIIK
jgi:phosphatidylethanolamine-binding protein (PEBP) family uncharacterized protein